ncbi:MAG: YchJ family metal-binding protein [Oxalicibacterium faecigallinarum]|uniref:YchJ family protein n=1 Tax=Oxalicibacterium faecigallinarum TaxID=573741 RepID=UPI002807B864|nr:YchJ family metal-binding protein [Oxalicibacterium faecigallinarum]MDQ7968302.1 YchJ family metal-binding protein [Oxalicibacterium faecigallinarum]
MKKPAVQACPCGGADYAQCCQPFHDGMPAPDAEKLMRSRYSAYVLGHMPYVHASWHASTRPLLDELVHDHGMRWLGLDVKKFVPDGNEATVEFVARSKVDGRAHRLHEVSRFVREDGRWFYIDGVFPAEQGRNNQKDKQA